MNEKQDFATPDKALFHYSSIPVRLAVNRKTAIIIDFALA
jgi:hypothetical protein